ncbi:hypothetical protein BDU57DRAFT_528457 [Ampelomyces quisqualis]|uniref:F-box domain-containing protein n=1 Tax=Ampelomyces quisqualis TaxID=50730 RepID=A0A6A5QRC9_AMPQU|nr:hypothetical protein BDU57DRAFT_528457 [Ampelomyces quisqualis]
MPLLSDLPVELLNSMYILLDDRKDVLSLRHTCRKLAVASLDEFDKSFESIVVTSSVAGLTRLRHLVADAGDERLSRITYVTIHTLTTSSLKELAVSMQGTAGHPYLHAYAYTRTVLINSLNCLPTLKRVAITNHSFTGTPFEPHDQTEASDPLIVHRPRLHDFDFEPPLLHAFESALSVLPALTNKHCELYLFVSAMDPFTEGFSMILEYPQTPHVSDLLDIDGHRFLESREAFEKRRGYREAMFGTRDFGVQSIIIESLRRVEMVLEGMYLDEYRWFLDVVEASRCKYFSATRCHDQRFVEDFVNPINVVCLAPGHEMVGDCRDSSWDYTGGF